MSSASGSNGFLERVRAEYLEMPGLRLTNRQVERLCGLERAACQEALDALVAGKFLSLKAGSYALVTDIEDDSRHRVSDDNGEHHYQNR